MKQSKLEDSTHLLLGVLFCLTLCGTIDAPVHDEGTVKAAIARTIGLLDINTADEVNGITPNNNLFSLAQGYISSQRDLSVLLHDSLYNNFVGAKLVPKSGGTLSNSNATGSICDISPSDSLYLYVRAINCWNGVDARKALDTLRLCVEQHPYATQLPDEVLGAVRWTVTFTAQLSHWTKADWIENNNWLISILPLNYEPPYQFSVLRALAHNMANIDENEVANLWMNISFLFPDTGTVSFCSQEIRSIRRYQSYIPEDTMPFHKLTFPLQPLPGGTSGTASDKTGSVSFSVTPNPITDASVIRFEIPATGAVSISVYDLLGNERVKLVTDLRDKGSYSIPLNMGTLAQGMYFVRLSYGNTVLTRKIIFDR